MFHRLAFGFSSFRGFGLGAVAAAKIHSAVDCSPKGQGYLQQLRTAADAAAKVQFTPAPQREEHTLMDHTRAVVQLMKAYSGSPDDTVAEKKENFQSFWAETERRAVAEEVLDERAETLIAVDTLINRLRDAFNHIPAGDHAQRAFTLQFLHDLGETKLKRLGFQHFSDQILSTAAKHVAENGFGPVSLREGHKQPLDPEKQRRIAEIFYKHSRIHSAQSDNKFCDVFLLETNQDEVARECCRLLKCSRSSAIKYRPDDILLSSKQLTDLCEMCEDLIQFEQFGRELIRKYSQLYKGTIQETDQLEVLLSLESPLNLAQKQAAYRLIADIHTLKLHYELNQHQRQAKRIDTLRSATALQRVDTPQMTLLLDFKASVKLGEGPRERSNAYYGYSSASVLGFAVYLPGRETCVYIDAISSNLRHDAPTAAYVLQQVLEFIFTHPDLREDAAKTRKLAIWADCGPHFRAKRFFHCVFSELPDLSFLEGLLEIMLNFFLEKHGKSEVDGHFGCIVQWVKKWVSKKKLLVNADLQAAIEAGSEASGGPPVYVLNYAETISAVVSQSVLNRFVGIKKSYAYRWLREKGEQLENFGVGSMVGKITPKVMPLGEIPSLSSPDSDEDEDGEAGQQGEAAGEQVGEDVGEELSEQDQHDAQTRFTKWARDVAPEAQTDFGLQRRQHRNLRELCGTALFEGALDHIVKKIDEAQERSRLLAAHARVQLPDRRVSKMKRVKELLREPGRGLFIFAPDAQAWTVANVEYSDRTTKTNVEYVEVVIHHPTGAVSQGLSLAVLSHMVVPLAGTDETCVILAVNLFDPGFEDFNVDVMNWDYCVSCRRWRLIPNVTRENLKKRKNNKFICSDIHPLKGCDTLFSDYEKSWRNDPRALDVPANYVP